MCDSTHGIFLQIERRCDILSCSEIGRLSILSIAAFILFYSFINIDYIQFATLYMRPGFAGLRALSSINYWKRTIQTKSGLHILSVVFSHMLLHSSTIWDTIYWFIKLSPFYAIADGMDMGHIGQDMPHSCNGCRFSEPWRQSWTYRVQL